MEPIGGKMQAKPSSRACDYCRRKKRKCFPAGFPTVDALPTCGNCHAIGKVCTFLLDSQPRGPSKSYVSNLETQLQTLQEKLASIEANHLTPPSIPLSSSTHSLDRPMTRVSSAVPSMSRPVESPDTHSGIRKAMNDLEVADFPLRYHGSSSLNHIYVAVDGISGERDHQFMPRLRRSLRRDFWSIPPWECNAFDIGPKVSCIPWPEPRLEQQLVGAYFDNTHVHPPVLDQIVFRQDLRAGLYRRDVRFADVCWLVFALGARLVSPTISPHSTGFVHKLSAGWDYFANVRKVAPTLPDIPDHYTLQIASLTTTWLSASSSPHRPWLVCGTALRASQELGLHIANAMSHHVAEYQASKRAFWCLYHMDIQHCVAAGRRPVFREGDFDFDIPIGGDESSVIFHQSLLVDRITAQALTTLYGVEPTFRKGNIYDTVRQSSLALDHWEQALPSVLRFGTNYAQSGLYLDIASLHVQSRQTRILIWRPLLPSTRTPNAISLEALDQCVQASLDICETIKHLLTIDQRPSISPDCMNAIWTAQAILQLFLVLKYPEMEDNPIESDRLTGSMEVCVQGMKAIEEIWRYAGKLTDFMMESMRSLYGRYPRAASTRSAVLSDATLVDSNDMFGHVQTGANTTDDQASGVGFNDEDFDAIFAEVFGFVPSRVA